MNWLKRDPRRSPPRPFSGSGQTSWAARSPSSPLAARLGASRPLSDALELWLRASLETLSQKTKLAEAIRYALSRWAGQTLFLDDGRKQYRRALNASADR